MTDEKRRHYYVQKDGNTICDYENLCAAIKHAESIKGTVLYKEENEIDNE